MGDVCEIQTVSSLPILGWWRWNKGKSRLEISFEEWCHSKTCWTVDRKSAKSSFLPGILTIILIVLHFGITSIQKYFCDLLFERCNTCLVMLSTSGKLDKIFEETVLGEVCWMKRTPCPISIMFDTKVIGGKFSFRWKKLVSYCSSRLVIVRTKW